MLSSYVHMTNNPTNGCTNNILASPHPLSGDEGKETLCQWMTSLNPVYVMFTFGDSSMGDLVEFPKNCIQGLQFALT